MDQSRRVVLAAGTVALTAGCLGGQAEHGSIYEDYLQTTVEATGADGTVHESVTAAIAHTEDQRTTGLSRTDTLRPGWGMVFVFAEAAERTFFMREMDFGIDIIFADSDGTITAVATAPEPRPDEDGTDQRYHGRAQYVLEVAPGWAETHGIGPGGALRFRLPDAVGIPGPSQE